jgi:hypothetical protein
MDEHRTAQRHRVFKAGSIQFGGSTIDCTVRNLANTGAQDRRRFPSGPGGANGRTSHGPTPSRFQSWKHSVRRQHDRLHSPQSGEHRSHARGSQPGRHPPPIHAGSVCRSVASALPCRMAQGQTNRRDVLLSGRLPDAGPNEKGRQRMSAARPGKNLFEIKCPAPVQRTLIKNGEFVESELGFRSTEHYWRCRCARAAGVTGAYGINLAPSKERRYASRFTFVQFAWNENSRSAWCP